MDVNMPEFEPVESVKKIRESLPAIKILIVSAYDDQAYVVGLLSAGVNGYHLKDQPLSDLQAAVRRILDGGRWISDPLVNRLVNHQVAFTESAIHLTHRQRELLYLLTQGFNNQKIALVMDLSVKTVENHLTGLYRAISVESRLEANTFASHHPELLSAPGGKRAQGSAGPNCSEMLRVLLVDDNPRYRAQLGKLLKKNCSTSEIYEAEDAEEAIRISEQVKPQLAFIDIVLPDEDGIQCTRRIKLISPDTRSILISAYPDREFHRLGQNAGAVAFLDKKDIDTATIRQVIEDALGIVLTR
jgi:DNA-binding NarL/FixJ family response regulator